jgi:hypothetical protein
MFVCRSQVDIVVMVVVAVTVAVAVTTMAPGLCHRERSYRMEGMRLRSDMGENGRMGGIGGVGLGLY